jgi:plasmid stabilization system protein ParE
MPRRTYSFHKLAETDFEEAVAWYAANDVALAERFAAEIARLISIACEFPMLGSPSIRGTRRLAARKLPHVLVYRLTGDGILVLAVAHTSRDPKYWRNRL